jgi:hypothetical protein
MIKLLYCHMMGRYQSRCNYSMQMMSFHVFRPNLTPSRAEPSQSEPKLGCEAEARRRRGAGCLALVVVGIAFASWLDHHVACCVLLGHEYNPCKFVAVVVPISLVAGNPTSIQGRLVSPDYAKTHALTNVTWKTV